MSRVFSQPTLITDPEEIRVLYEFIQSQPLNYPRYEEWVKKCIRELEIGYKKALVYGVNGSIRANLIFQRHKQDPHVLEIKNCRVDPNFRRQGIFTSLVRAVEQYAKLHRFQRITVDTHSDNVSFIEAAKKLGFRVDAQEHLYGASLETILIKEVC